MEATYQEGRLDGKVTSWYEVGTIESEKEYREGLPHGTFKFYEKQAGKLKKEVKYKAGKKIEEEEK